MSKKIIYTDKAPEAIGPYSQATEMNDTLFVSGQIPIDPESGKLITGSIEDQTEMVLKNLKSILEGSGYSLKDVMKVEVFIDDMEEFSKMNEVYGKYFDEEPPARACIEVSNLPKNVKVEISLTAMKWILSFLLLFF